MKTIKRQLTMPPEAAAVTGERGLPRDEKEFVEFFMYALRAPVIVWPGWEDSFRDKWDQVFLHRLGHAKEVFAQQECTEFEAMLYVSSASLAQPLSRDWGDIYFWLFRRWNPKAAEQIDVQVPELDPSEREELARLRHWIFKKQTLHLKEKTRAARQDTLEQERREVEVTRPKLF